LNTRFRTATYSQEWVQSCPEGEGVGQYGGLAALVHLRASSEVLELPLHVLGSCVVLEFKSFEERDGRTEVGEVAPFERAQGVGVPKARDERDRREQLQRVSLQGNHDTYAGARVYVYVYVYVYARARARADQYV
jgi:hypothetical protein